MTREQTFDKLYRMKLHGMAKALEEQLKQPDMADLSFEERLAMLVDAQWIWRENRSLATRLSAAKLKQQASMEDINFRHPRQLDRGMIRSLASCDWVREHHNIAVSGPSGIGMRIPAKLATDSSRSWPPNPGMLATPSERSDAGLFISSLTWPTSVKKNHRSTAPQHHLLSVSPGNLVKVGLSSVEL